jgi:glycosyltransferase involved in cell wall biosynthesis
LDIIFFKHPDFTEHKSMPRYARMLAEGMKKRGHKVDVWSPQPFFYKIPAPSFIQKWLGYLDQYMVFPMLVRKRLRKKKSNALFVFTDHALGPWVSLVANKPHVVHCHDFLAQYSAMRIIQENQVGWTGRQYQAYIHQGYSKAKNFISISQKTRDDLHRFLSSTPVCSEVVYNGFHQSFGARNIHDARKLLSDYTKLNLIGGYILHVGGNQWYKNRRGVIEAYSAWHSIAKIKLPLLMIGEKPDKELVEIFSQANGKEDIFFINNAADEQVRLGYSGASAFLFPSLAEGFGWPIAEAMASGCPVITTNEAPMTEVAGNAGFYIPKYPFNKKERNIWAKEAAEVLNKIVELADEERKKVVQAGFNNAKRFDTENTMKRIEAIYSNILEQHI